MGGVMMMIKIPIYARTNQMQKNMIHYFSNFKLEMRISLVAKHHEQQYININLE